MLRAALWILLILPAAGLQRTEEAAYSEPRKLEVTAGKSMVLDSAVTIERISVANADVAEALAVTPREVLVNGKAVGETTLIIWQQDGDRLMFDLSVRPNLAGVEAAQRLIREAIADRRREERREK